MLVLSTLSSDRQRRVPGIDESLLRPVGELAASFSMLEEELRSQIKLLMFPFDQLEDVIADVVTSELSFRRRVELIQCLFDLRAENDSQKEQLKDLCKRALQLEEQRNAITHSYWGFDHEANTSVRLKTTAKAKGLRYQRQPMAAEDVGGVVQGIGELTRSLEEFFESVKPSEHELVEYYESVIERYRNYIDQYRAQSGRVHRPAAASSEE